MNRALVILIAVAVIAAAKVFFVVGLGGTPRQYISVLQTSMIVEYVLWIALAVTFQQLLESRRLYLSAHCSRVYRYIADSSGEKQSAVSTQISYEQSKNALGWAKIAFGAALLGTLVVSFS